MELEKTISLREQEEEKAKVEKSIKKLEEDIFCDLPKSLEDPKITILVGIEEEEVEEEGVEEEESMEGSKEEREDEEKVYSKEEAHEPLAKP